MTAPAITVIMAAYNGTALIGETLRSLAAQTFPDWEAVVVDDCSTDETLELLRGWPDRRVRALTSPRNAGPVAARNRAVAEARGRYLAALDQDDLAHPERFARQVGYLDGHPETVLVGTAALVLQDGETRPSSHAAVTTPGLVEWLLHIENPLVWSSTMMRADVARRLDPFTRPERIYAEDFDLYHRLAPIGRVARLDEALTTYRQHAGGVSKIFADRMRDAATAVLAERYAPMLGDAATSAAGLIADHVMAQRPVPDRATLARLGATLVELQAEFLRTHVPTRDERKLIRWETARRWARIARAGLRTGSLRLGDAVSVRPDHLGLGHAGVEQLIWSRLIGGARVARRALQA